MLILKKVLSPNNRVIGVDCVPVSIMIKSYQPRYADSSAEGEFAHESLGTYGL